MTETTQVPESNSKLPDRSKGDNNTSPGARLLAWLTDVIVVTSIAMLLIAVLQLSTGIYIYIDIFVLIVSLWIVGFAYAIVFDRASNGQTFGKMLFSLYTVDEKTLKKAPLKSVIIDNSVKFSPFVILDALIGLILNRGNKGDKIRISQNLSNVIVIRKSRA